MMDFVKNEYDMPDEGRAEVLAFARYPDLERAADRTAAKIKEGFMEMGYILKVARDTDILSGSGYGSHEEFAEKRYGLDKGTVSRYIRIVERFSVGGNSHVLQEGYKNIGFAKLSLMLHMPDAIAEEITEGYSKQEVQAIKEEIDAEHAVSDIEVAIEAAEAPEKEGSLLERAVHQLGREQPALYRKLHEVCAVGGIAAVGMGIDVLAPQGEAMYMVRIPGTGRLMISLSGTAASVTNVRSGDKERYTRDDVMTAVVRIMHACPVEESWQQEYGEPMEPVEEAAHGPVEAQAPKKEKRKTSKVVKAAPPKAAVKPEPERPVKAAAEPTPPEPEEQLPGQMEIVDFPDAIPDAHYEEITEAPSDGAAGIQDKGDGPAAVPAAGGTDEDTDPSTKNEELCMEIRRHMDSLQKYFAVWDNAMPMEYLHKAYLDAVDLAADIERLLDLKRKEETDGQEYHA